MRFRMHLKTVAGIHLERYCWSDREAPSRLLVVGILLLAVDEGGDEQADGDDPLASVGNGGTSDCSDPRTPEREALARPSVREVLRFCGVPAFAGLPRTGVQTCPH
jgi:hypothetical protein